MENAVFTAKLSPAELRALVFQWHANQEDGAKQPYTGHLQRVADNFEETSLEYRVALLHDCMEDQDITVEMLESIGECSAVIAAVVAITHPHGEPNTVYWERVCSNSLACKVKLFDILDNLDPDRLYYLPEDRRWRMIKKYQKALHFILTRKKEQL